MSEKLSKADQEKILETARKRFKICQDADSDNRKRALEAIKFCALEQWPEAIKDARLNDPKGARPCLVVDKLNQHINQVKNDQRQNRPSIKVRPVDNKGDKQVADVLNGIIRHIEDISHADVAYDTGFEQTVSGGYGYWRIITKYCDENSFDQDILIQRIRNRFAVYLDPDHQEPDGSDAKYGFIYEDLTKDEYEANYPNHKISNWESSKETGDWLEEKKVRVAEYFTIEHTKNTIVLLSTGDVVPEKELQNYLLQNRLDPQTVTVKRQREASVPKVCWYKLNGTEVLEKKDWAGRYIPIVKVIGNELDIEGKVKLTGLIETAMDAQRMYNYAASAFIEQVALAPKAPYIIAEGQVEGYENDWASANRLNHSALTYKPVSLDGSPVPPPMRQAPPGIPAGWQQTMANMEHDIQSAMGQYRESLGEESNAKSGKAILARQREGDVGTFHFVDNLSRSIRHTGTILLDLIPKIIDTQRVMRILGEDGKPQTVELDPTQQAPVANKQDEMGKAIGKIYNLSVGKYDVAVTVGPSYTTKRQEAAESMVELVRADPSLMAKIGDLMVKAMDWPESERVADRLKMFLPPEFQEDGEGGDQDARANAMVKILQQKLQEAEGMIQQAVQSVEAMEARNKSRELDIKMYEAETKRLEVISDKDETQKQVGEISQQVQQLMRVIQPQAQSPGVS